MQIHLPSREELDLCGVRVDTYDVVANVCEACGRRQTDVSGTDHHDALRSTHSIFDMILHHFIVRNQLPSPANLESTDG